MKYISQNSGNVLLLPALVLVVTTPLYAEVAPELTLGETITVAGKADASAVTCSGTSPTISCPTLRSAVAHANGNANAVSNKYDVINLDSGTYALSLGELDLTEPVNIMGAGAGATIIDGGGSGGMKQRMFDIYNAAFRADPDTVDPVTTVVVIDGVTIQNGYGEHVIGGAIFNDEKASLALSNCAMLNNTATWDGDELTKETQGSGGAVYSKDVLTIESCVFRGNTAYNIIEEVKVGNGGAVNTSQYTVINNSTFGSNADIDEDSNKAINGGALFMTGGNPVVITNTTLSYNDAVSGGGLNVVSKAAGMEVEITNSTFSGNHVTDSGAGIETNAPMTLLNVTIANNRKDSNNKGSGYNTGPGVPVTFKNVLIDNNLHDANTSFIESSNCGLKSPGVLNMDSQGGNVSSDDTCLLTHTSDQENATVNLIALADNGGPTFTNALPDPMDAASAAVDKGLNDGCPNNDQRGSKRPFNATTPTQQDQAICDSGAYEVYVERADLHIENMTAPDKVLRGDDVTIEIVVDNGNVTTPTAADGVMLTTTLPTIQLGFVSATASVGTCNEADGVVTCDIGTLAADAEASVSIIATADTLKPGVIVGTNVTSISPPDPDINNNSDDVTFDIVEATDLEMTAGSASPAALGVGGVSTVSITVVNNGPAVATGVIVSGPVPSLVSFVQGIGCDDTTVPGDITCQVGTLANGASADVIFEVRADAVGTTLVSAYAEADQMELSPNDNGGEATISIGAGDGGGGFCSYNPDGRFDPVLPALIMIAISLLGYRRLSRESMR